MKRFLFRTALFFTPVLFFIGITEYLLKHIPTDFSFKANYLKANGRQINTLILGSSHTLFSLDPRYFKQRTFNLAMSGQTLSYDYAILKKYAPGMKHLKTVILPVSYFSFFYDLRSGPEPWRQKYYALHYGIDLDPSLSNHLEICNGQLMTNLHRIKGYYLDNEKTVSCQPDGWSDLHKTKSSIDLETSGRIAAERHTYDLKQDSTRQKLNYNLMQLIGALDYCKTNKINVILITTPTYFSYRKNTNPQQLALTYSIINKISKSYPFKYYDFSSSARFDSLDFYDADHLNEIGTKKFSIIVDSIERTVN